MAKDVYIGVSNKASKVRKIYIGVSNTARKIKKAYIGVNGVAKLFYSASAIYKTTDFNISTGRFSHQVFPVNDDYIIIGGGRTSSDSAVSGGFGAYDRNLTRTSISTSFVTDNSGGENWLSGSYSASYLKGYGLHGRYTGNLAVINNELSVSYVSTGGGRGTLSHFNDFGTLYNSGSPPTIYIINEDLTVNTVSLTEVSGASSIGDWHYRISEHSDNCLAVIRKNNTNLNFTIINTDFTMNTKEYSSSVCPFFDSDSADDENGNYSYVAGPHSKGTICFSIYTSTGNSAIKKACFVDTNLTCTSISNSRVSSYDSRFKIGDYTVMTGVNGNDRYGGTPASVKFDNDLTRVVGYTTGYECVGSSTFSNTWAIICGGAHYVEDGLGLESGLSTALLLETY